jgi:NAD(P)-dependent dehydrogenase (short-subunit alcohol dehydrogenase family)
MAWSNQVAVVTGGARGIGRAAALLLAQRGAAVCVNYATRADAAEEVVHEINRGNGHAIAVGADVADAAAVASMIELAHAQLGPVTIVVNNAGIGFQATLDTYEPEKLQRMRAVNVDGIIHTVRAAMADMRQRRYGRIVNVASNAAIGTSLPGNAFYAASKGEVPILTRRMAMELGPDGITVNCVAPGFTRTDMTRRNRGRDDWAAVEKTLAERAMTRRIGEPEDIANAIAFLAAPESGWITAQTLVVDGGRLDYIGHG